MRTRSILLFLVLATFPCATTWADQRSDNEIDDKVRIKLAGDAEVKGSQLTVEVKDGVVTLRGKVESERGKNRAAKLAHKVKGVKSVANELTIEKH
jgi:hyperosmotically inducible periplasmic protein